MDLLKFKVTSVNRRTSEDGVPLEVQVTCYGVPPPPRKDDEPNKNPFYGRATNSVLVLQMRDEQVQELGLKEGVVLQLVKAKE